MKKDSSHVTIKDNHGICFVYKNKNFKVLFPLIIFFVVLFIIASCFLSFTSQGKIPPPRARQQEKADLVFRDPSDIYYEKASSDPEFWQAEPTPIHQAFQQYFAKTLESCNPRCNTSEEWCRAKGYRQWNAIQRRGDMPYTPFLARGQYVFDWEKTYLSYPPLTDLQALPSLRLSKITVENAYNDTVPCFLNEDIHGRADLMDGYGKPRQSGNDEVRVWLSTCSEPVERYAAAGEVTDLGNGSYSFSVTCLWPGTSVLNVAVAYPREFLRVAVHQHYVGVTRFSAGFFKKGNLAEVTVCHSTPNIPGRPCICNLTSLGQTAWYCGRPWTQGLTCADLTDYQALFLSPPSDVTPAELTLVKNTPGSAKNTTIRHDIQVVTPNLVKLPSLPPCSSTNINITWSHKRPRGFWSPGLTWNSRLCQEEPLTKQRLSKCLRNKTVWIYGDSNAIRMYQTLKGILSCRNVLGTKWPRREACESKGISIRINFTPHEYPLVLTLGRTPRFTYGGVARQIDAIPSTGSHILIVHYFLHYVPGHYSVLYKRMVALRDAVKRLFKRNPDVTVALRGPHILTRDWDVNHVQGGDALASHYLDIIREVFSDLYHKVIFLDGWGMTIGLENEVNHPLNAVPRHMLQALFSFAPCP